MKIKININLKTIVVLFVMAILFAVAACVIEDDPLRIGRWDQVKWDNAAWGE
ncbi:MAG: hypothetical protein JXJ04_18630 [Spirochaetales bacterium]|nr:hypothetical protein [Spirochaetales bacterium]